MVGAAAMATMVAMAGLAADPPVSRNSRWPRRLTGWCAGADYDWSPFPQETDKAGVSRDGEAPRGCVVSRLFDTFAKNAGGVSAMQHRGRCKLCNWSWNRSRNNQWSSPNLLG